MWANKLRTRRLLSVLAGCLLAAFLFSQGAPSAYGQATSNATLSGTVTDSSGAAVPGATVTLTDTTKGFSRSQTTPADGVYSFTFIPASTYTIRVEKTGFKVFVQEGLILAVGTSATKDIALELGAVTAEVKVTAAAPLLNTTNATVGSDVGARETVELPLNWRNVFGLVALDSSVNPTPNNQAGAGGEITDQGITYAIEFGGGRHRNNCYLLDGHWNNTGDWGGVIYVPGVDETQEFKMITKAFTAQYGWSMGNVMNVITKSGTEKWHGTGFLFHRNDNLDANYFFANAQGVDRQEFKRNTFGGSIGGPLWKDKFFVFGYYEGLRQSFPYTFTGTVPTNAMKGGDFSALLGSASTSSDILGRPVYNGAIYDPFTSRYLTAGQTDATTGLTATSTGYVREAFGATSGNSWAPTNVIPSGMFDTVASNLLQYWPAPTGSGLTNNFFNAGSLPGWVDKYSIRADYVISDKSRFFARWAWNDIFQQGGGDYFGKDNPGGPGSGNPNPRWDIGLNYTRTFNPTTVLSVTGGWNRWYEGFRPTTGEGFVTSSLGLPSFLDVIPFFPSICPDGMTCLGAGYWSATPREPRTLMVDLTKVHGGHTMTMGFQNIWMQNYERFIDPAGFNFDRGMSNGPDPTSPLAGTGYGFASFLMGAGAGAGTPGQFTAQGSGGQFPLADATAFMKKYIGAYFQDDWKVNRRLTLNLGLRWDMQSSPTERFDRIWSFERSKMAPYANLFPSSYTDPDGGTHALNLQGFLTPVGSANASFGRSVYNSPKNGFVPRIGLAYKLTDKLVARAGYGIFNIESLEVSSYQGLSLYGFSTLTPWVATVGGITPFNLLSDPFPDGYIHPTGFAQGELTNIGQSIDNFPPGRRKYGYVSQWTGSLQYQFTPNDVLDITYMGNRGTGINFATLTGNQLTPDAFAVKEQWATEVPNPFYAYFSENNLQSGCGLDQPNVPYKQLLRPHPQYCGVAWRYMPGATSNYNALAINYRHSWKGGLHMNASFTWSVFRDNSSGPGYGYVPDRDRQAGEYSINYNNIPKAFVLSYIYELPFGRGKRWGANINKFANAILGGWQISGITTFKDGFPLNFGANNNMNNFNASNRADLVGDPTVANPTIERWFNTEAFAEPAAYTFGNSPRYLENVRAAGRNNWDLNVSKEWKWQERLRIQFRGELFNAFNHTYFFAPSSYVDFSEGSAFGTVSGSGQPRDVQLGLKVYW